MFTLRNIKPSWILQPVQIDTYPDSKVCGANMVPIWGRQDPGGPHVGLMNLAIWVVLTSIKHLFVRCIILYSSNISIFNYMISRIDRQCHRNYSCLILDMSHQKISFVVQCGRGMILTISPKANKKTWYSINITLGQCLGTGKRQDITWTNNCPAHKNILPSSFRNEFLYIDISTCSTMLHTVPYFVACCLDKVSGAKLFHTRNRPHHDMLHLHISIVLTFFKWLASHLI